MRKKFFDIVKKYASKSLISLNFITFAIENKVVNEFMDDYYAANNKLVG